MMTLIPSGRPICGLEVLGKVVRSEVEQARRRIADAYHSLEILSAWCGHQAWRGKGQGQADLATALSLVATVTRQQAAVGKEDGLVTGGRGLTDWDLEADFGALDFVEAGGAVVDELLILAQVFLDTQEMLPEKRKTTMLRTTGSLLTVAANLNEVFLKCREKIP